MIKAHSLLYAVFICLIVSIICGATLYLASLYNQLNLFYNFRESLYIQNQSYVSYALENLESENNTFLNERTGVVSSYQNKGFGLLNILRVATSGKSDTVVSVHLTGGFSKDKTCLYVAATGNPFYYSGKVKLVGEKKLSTTRIEQKYIDGRMNSLDAPGTILLAQPDLPDLNPAIADFFSRPISNGAFWEDIEKHVDSVYFNSFKSQSLDIRISGHVLANTTIKGNFILHASDSLFISKSAVLEDVIVKAPKIVVEEGFRGNIQVFASERIEVGRNAVLSYPSVLCLLNGLAESKAVVVGENAMVYGAVVVANNLALKPDDDLLVFKKNSLLVGDAYCNGKLMVEGVIHGSAYTKKVFYRTATSNYENCIVDAEIDATKRPPYFVSIPILKSDKRNIYNGVFKKVF